MNTQEEQIIQLNGGLDLVTPSISKSPGSCIAAKNYESNDKGYGRMQGYERLDGRPSPHLASYWGIPINNATAAISQGDVVVGATSGATGIVLFDLVFDTGTIGAGDAAGTLYGYDVTGEFLDNEAIEIASIAVALVDGFAIQRPLSDTTEDKIYLNTAIESRRSNIQAVPGNGPVLGVCTYKGDKYAFRNTADGLSARMFKATHSGWEEQLFGATLDFTNGTAEFHEGETVMNGTATATIERVVRQTGSWASDAAGYLVLSNISGTFEAGPLTTLSGLADAVGAQQSIALAPGGKYRAIGHNFYGSSNLRRLYFVNGVSTAFEWDGLVLTPIRTGLDSATDQPEHIGVHSNHLILGYRGGHLFGSGTGLPLSYDAIDGAFEQGIGQDITGIKSSARTSTVISSRNKISYMQGNDATDIRVDDISEDSGAASDTLEVIGEVHFLDDIGVRSLTSSQRFGDWAQGTVTERIEPLFKAQKVNGNSAVGALRVRSKNQYRLFFESRGIVSIYFGRSEPESMLLELQFTPTCLVSGEDENGNEVLLVGSDDGFVYQFDVGASADGQPIEAFVVLAPSHQGIPNREKRYHRSLVSTADGDPDTVLYCSASFGEGQQDAMSSQTQDVSFPGGGGIWDIMRWDQFYWDGDNQIDAHVDLDGVGKNVSIAIASEESQEDPHTLTHLSIFWSPRRKLR